MTSGNSIRQTVHTHRASVRQVAKLVAALLRVARVTAGLAESNGSLLSGLWQTSTAGWLPRTGISSGTVRSAVEYGLPVPFTGVWVVLCCRHSTMPASWSLSAKSSRIKSQTSWQHAPATLDSSSTTFPSSVVVSELCCSAFHCLLFS